MPIKPVKDADRGRPRQPRRPRLPQSRSHLLNVFRRSVAAYHGYPDGSHDDDDDEPDTSESTLGATLSTNENISVAELMEDADAVLDIAGYSIDASVEDPEEFIEAVANLLDEEDLDEDSEEALCLGIALIESILGMQELSEGELPEASVPATLHRQDRRSMEKQMPFHLGKGIKKNWGPGGEDKLAAKAVAKKDAAEKAKSDAIKAASPRTFAKDKARMKRSVKAKLAATAPDALQDKEHHAILRKYLDRMNKMKKLSTSFGKFRDTRGAKKASNEEVESPDAEVNALVDMIESAGYEVPDDLPVEDFLAAVEDLATQDAVVAEGLGQALAGAGIRMLKSKTAAWAAKKLAKAGTNALAKKMTGESVEDADELMATMIEVVTSNGYEFEGTEEAFDPEKFLDVAEEIAESDEELGEDISAWLKKSATAIRTMAEAGQYGALPARGSPGLRKFVKKSTSKKARRDAKRDPENAPKKKPIKGWAD